MTPRKLIESWPILIAILTLAFWVGGISVRLDEVEHRAAVAATTDQYAALNARLDTIAADVREVRARVDSLIDHH